jgi:hypothetical protein
VAAASFLSLVLADSSILNIVSISDSVKSEDLGSAVKSELENFDKEGPFDAVEWEHNYIQPRVKAFVELV